MNLTLISALELFWIAIGVARLSYAMVNEDGPYGLLARFRMLVGMELYPVTEEWAPEVEHSPVVDWQDETYYAYPETMLAKLLSCVYCASLNFSILSVVLYYFFPEVAILALTPFTVGYFATRLGAEL